MHLDEKNVLLNAALLYAALVLVTIVIAAIVFIIRALFTRKSILTTLSLPVSTQAGSGNAQVSVDPESQKYAYSWFGDKKNKILAKFKFTKSTNPTGSLKQYKLKDWPYTEETKTELATTKKSPFRFINVIELSISPLIAEKRKYSIEELFQLQPPLEKPISGSVRISLLLQYRSPYPPLRLLSPLQSDDYVVSISHLLQAKDSVAQTLGLLRLVCLSQSRHVFANPVHFLESYCKALVKAAGEPEIFGRQCEILREGLFNSVACFCWEHWHLVSALHTMSGPTKTNSPIFAALNFTYREFFVPWSLDPFNVNRAVIFQIFLCVAQYSLSSLPKANSTHRVATLLKECACNTECLEFRELLPILGQMIASSQKLSNKKFSYEVLAELLQPHVNCCLSAEDVYSLESILQALIRHGLAPDQHNAVREISTKICEDVGLRFTEVSLWVNLDHVHKLSEKKNSMVAPGAWLVFH